MDLAAKVYEQAAKENQNNADSNNNNNNEDHETVEDATYEEKQLKYKDKRERFNSLFTN